MTIRYFLGKGDRSATAVIVDGLSTCTCSGVQIATLGMSTYCYECQTYGYIYPVGNRPRGTAPNGQGWALSGDLNICQCGSQPIFANRILRTNVGGSDCAFLNRAKWRVQAPMDFYKHKNGVAFVKRGIVKRAFPLSTGDALLDTQEYDGAVQGHPFKLYAPAGPVSSLTRLVTNALQVVPFQQLMNLTRISINSTLKATDVPGSNMYTEAYASLATYNNNATGALDHLEGDIDIFPSPTLDSQEVVDSLLLHESGHLWNFSFSPEWQNRYEASIKNEPTPSKYGETNIKEDFAETASLYWATINTRCEAEARQLHGARFAFFDEIVGAGV